MKLLSLSLISCLGWDGLWTRGGSRLNIGLQGLLVLGGGLLAGGCAAPPTQSGYLSSYSQLEKRSDSSFRYAGEDAVVAGYDRFIVEPVAVYDMGEFDELPEEERDKLLAYFRQAAVDRLEEDGAYTVVSEAGPGVARVRASLTRVKPASWWLNLYWATKLAGVATGEVAVEAEVVDSVSGEQLMALVEAQRGNAVELDFFDVYDDSRDVADRWAEVLRGRLDQARAEPADR